MKLLAVLVALSLLITPAQALTIRNDPGGVIIDYATRVARIKQSGEKVVIAGRCASACTLFLALPPRQLCVKPGASFGFHLPYGASQEGNLLAAMFLMKNYPKWVRDWINAKGGLSKKMIYMNYSYIRRHLPRC